MVVYAVAEEYSLGVDQEILILFRGLVSVVVFQYLFEHFSDFEVIFEILCPKDIPSVFGSFPQMVDIFFLLKGQVFPARNAETHYFDIGKFVNKVLEVIFFLFTFCTT